MPDKKTFRVPLPKTGLEFTGERCTTLVEGEVLHEHLHRYFFALQFCQGKDVLDIASGEGYGAALLASIAATVTGVDVAPEAVRHATENYVASNLTFLRGVATNVPVEDSAADVVVSFETLEHMSEQEQFLREIKRVLRPGGVLVMSTPDREFFATWLPNPFHLKELNRASFRQLIDGYFRNAAYLIQTSLTGSVIASDGNETPNENGAGTPERPAEYRPYQGFRHVQDNLFESAPTLPSGMYMLCVASDELLPEMRTGSFEDREFQRELYAERERSRAEMARRDADFEKLSRENNTISDLAVARETELSRQREEILRCKDEADRLRKDNSARRAREIEHEAELLRKRHECNRLEGKLASLQEIHQRQTERLVREGIACRTETRNLSLENSALRTRGTDLETALGQSGNELLRARAEAHNLTIECDSQRREIADLRVGITTIEHSWSWRVTAPLRWAGILPARIWTRRAASDVYDAGLPLHGKTVSPAGREWQNSGRVLGVALQSPVRRAVLSQPFSGRRYSGEESVGTLSCLGLGPRARSTSAV